MISHLELWLSCSVEGNYLCNFESGHHGEHSCEFIVNLDQWFRRKMRFKENFYGHTMHDGRRFSSGEPPPPQKKTTTKNEEQKTVHKSYQLPLAE